MKLSIVILAALVLGQAVHLPSTASADTPEAGLLAELDGALEWGFQPDPALPSVLLLGDSISIGYTLPVRGLLEGKANVFRPMLSARSGGKKPRFENCQGTTRGVQRIDGWLAGRQWDVIHFNFGLHDLKHVTVAGTSKNSQKATDPYQATVEQYEANLRTIVGKLQATGARLVFATTTPVVPNTKGVPREPEAPGKYNAAALQIMRAESIRVNDLYTYVLPHLEDWQLPLNVHFKAVGSKALAERVAEVIAEELAARD